MIDRSSADRVRRRNARVLYVAFILSGAAGLVYEVVWAALLGQLVGGTTATHTVVLAAFMGGLALGNRFGGRWADGRTAPLRLYAWLEVAVGVLGVLSPRLADLAGTVYVALAPVPESGLAFLDLPLRVLLAACTILPGAFFMGGTLPALVRATTDRLGSLGRSVGWLYFVNSVGATAGAFAAGFLLIPKLGLELSVILAGMVNLGLAVVALALLRISGEPSEAPAPADPSGKPARTYTPRQARAAVQAVLLSGVATMVVEIVWTRVLGLTMGGSAHAFSIMLSTFIGGIALGGIIASRIAGDDRDAFRPLLWAEAIAAGSLLLLAPWYDRLPFLFHRAASQLARDGGAYPLYLAISTGIAILAMIIPTVAMGATLPLASRVATGSLGEAGHKVGSVFSVNTLGNVAGAAIGGLLLVPTLGLETSLHVGIGVLVLAALRLVIATGARPVVRWATVGIAAAAVAALVLSPGWNLHVLHAGLYRVLDKDYGSVEEFEATSSQVEFLFAEDDAEATVSVVQNAAGHRLLRINGKSDASNHGDVPTQVLVGQLPALFHPAPKRVLVVGLGSGITVGTLLAHDAVERVDVVEISPAVVRASRYFDEWSGAPLDDPRVHLHVQDARSFLKVSPQGRTWDVVVSEPSNPWQPGSAMLFTQEYYELLASRLAPGGVMSQWVHTYEMNDRVLETILLTYGSVFGDARVWNSKGNDMVLLAAPDGLEADFDRLEDHLARPAVAEELARITPDGREVDMLTLLSHEVMGPGRFRARWGHPEGRNLHTDRFPVLQYQAPRAFFAGEPAETFRHADQRHMARGAVDLLASRWLGERHVLREDLVRLHDYFDARDRSLDEAVERALAAELWERAPDAADSLERLAAADALDISAEARLWQATLEEGVPDTKERCMAWIDHEFRRLAMSVSIYTPARWARFDSARDTCLERYPDLAEAVERYDVRLEKHRPETIPETEHSPTLVAPPVPSRENGG
ncbi:MAG: fused MFS/spermidine synthase [Myxococcota bacterium]